MPETISANSAKSPLGMLGPSFGGFTSESLSPLAHFGSTHNPWIYGVVIALAACGVALPQWSRP